MKSMFSLQMPVRSLIKVRPMAIGLLEKRKVRFWDSLDKPVAEVFRRDGMEDFLDEVSYARVAAHDTEWAAMPLYVLVDYLTHEHRSMMLQEVADISHLLDIHALSDSAESADLRAIQQSFKKFVHDFEVHIAEEENHLFPKILRYEACLRDRSVHPEFHRGSLQAYMATPKAKEDKRFYQDGSALALRLRALEAKHQGSIPAQELAELMETLRDKLTDHYELESTVLYTTARELERNLYNLTIDGHPAMAFQRRGPMDSGIMRLDEG
jgi:iron-sulfur cluster repair protein YtfE (RIC family)